MFHSKILFPVFFECVHTDFSITGHIWVEYFSQEKTWKGEFSHNNVAKPTEVLNFWRLLRPKTGSTKQTMVN